MSEVGVIILAAGKGTRMKSEKPKVTFELAGKSLLQRVINTSLKINSKLIGVVVGFKKELVVKSIIKHPNIQFVDQDQQNGTGHAVKCAKDLFADFTGTVFILCGDVPLLRAETLLEMLSFHEKSNAKCTVLTMLLDDPDKYGRIVRDDNNNVKEIVEFKDASEEIRLINEINTGIYCFDSVELFKSLEKVDNNNQQNEYYLTDVIKILYNNNEKVESVLLNDISEAAGINSQIQLAELEAEHYKKNREYWMNNGVTIENPDSVLIQEDVLIENDVYISANVKITGNTILKSNAYIGLNSYVHNSVIESESVLKGFNVVLNQKNNRMMSLDWYQSKGV